jgi:hypothetical protein
MNLFLMPDARCLPPDAFHLVFNAFCLPPDAFRLMPSA